MFFFIVNFFHKYVFHNKNMNLLNFINGNIFLTTRTPRFIAPYLTGVALVCMMGMIRIPIQQWKLLHNNLIFCRPLKIYVVNDNWQHRFVACRILIDNLSIKINIRHCQMSNINSEHWTVNSCQWSNIIFRYQTVN